MHNIIIYIKKKITVAVVKVVVYTPSGFQHIAGKIYWSNQVNLNINLVVLAFTRFTHER